MTKFQTLRPRRKRVIKVQTRKFHAASTNYGWMHILLWALYAHKLMEGCFAIRPHFELEFHLCMRVHIYERLSARPLENWIPLLRKSTRAFDVNCSMSYSRGRHTWATRKVLCSNLHIVPSAAGTKATPWLDCPPCAHHPAHYNTQPLRQSSWWRWIWCQLLMRAFTGQ